MIRIRQVKIPILEDTQENHIHKVCQKLKIDESLVKDIHISKKSIDARDKKNILYVYEFDIKCFEEEKIIKKNSSSDIFLLEEKKYNFLKSGTELLKERPIIVGSGPAGLFCAYILAENGYKPIILERGEKIEDRIKTVERFFKENILNPESNIQFGEGGAGTFSDGKLNTLSKDNIRGKKVLEIFVENGAPKEILYESHPHIGTDILRHVIINIRNKILSFGGEIHYNSCVTNIIKEQNRIVGVEINHDKIMNSEVVVMAIGHSARDTFYMLNKNSILMKPKNFAVGLRVEHPRSMIDKSQYGESASYLRSASYKLTYQTSKNRAVYSFCMCPGGFVVNASSEKGRICCNGMSNYKRDESNSNSAIVVAVTPNDFGTDLFAGLEFQRELEKKAYEEGKGYLPVQLLKDFEENQPSNHFGEYLPNTKGQTSFANLNHILPKYISEAIIEGMREFGKKIKGFDREDTILIGVETRTSSPIVIVRDEKLTSSLIGLYPCGEGAGYAGGITTAAIDGLKVAEEIGKKYKY